MTARFGSGGVGSPWPLIVVLVALLISMGTPRVMDGPLLVKTPTLVGCSDGATISSPSHGERDKRYISILESRPFVGVGHFSYSLYLVHSPLLFASWVLVVEPLDIPFDLRVVIMMVVVVPLVMLAAYGFSVAFERPFLNHKLPSAGSESAATDAGFWSFIRSGPGRRRARALTEE